MSASHAHHLLITLAAWSGADYGWVIDEARGWLIDCGMGVDDAAALPDESVAGLIARHYDGGVRAYVDAVA